MLETNHKEWKYLEVVLNLNITNSIPELDMHDILGVFFALLYCPPAAVFFPQAKISNKSYNSLYLGKIPSCNNSFHN